jgi:hypothetical protein
MAEQTAKISEPTPGPWELLQVHVLASGHGTAFISVDEDGEQECEVRVDGINAGAVARLIVAAPELLVAAKAACETGNRHKLDALQEAIDKAEGRS